MSSGSDGAWRPGPERAARRTPMPATSERVISAAAAAGLVGMAVLGLSGGVQAGPAARPAFGASQGPEPGPATARPEASDPDRRQASEPGADRIALVAVAAVAVGTFTVLQVTARSRSGGGPRDWPP